MVQFRWNQLSSAARLVTILGLALGTWSVPLLIQVPASGTLGDCEYGLCFLYLLLVPVTIFLLAAAVRLLFLPLTLDATKSAAYSVLVASLLPLLLSVAYGIHLRYWCWPHHPIEFCA